MKPIAMILAGGEGTRLTVLSEERAKPAVPFAGKFRIIDFTISNCVNSGIYTVGILTQYQPHSLNEHIAIGKPWDLDRSRGGVRLLQPYLGRRGQDWYAGTADAIFQNLNYVREQRADTVVVLSGDHIYKMDYGAMLAFHVEQQADMTVSCLEVPLSEAAGSFGVMTVDDAGRIVRFDEKPAAPTPIPGQSDLCLASMGNYVFNTKFLYEQLIRDHDDPNSEHDFGKNIIPGIIGKYRVFAYPFRDAETGQRAFWRDVGTLDAFWQANMELIGVSPELNLYDAEWPILTYQVQLPPAKFVFDSDERRGMAVDSMVSGGCVISGAKLRRSLLFSNVKIHSYTTIEETVVLPEVEIGRRCTIRRAIIDRGCNIPDGTTIGVDHAEDKKRGFRVSEQGITLVTPDMLGQPIHFVR